MIEIVMVIFGVFLILSFYLGFKAGNSTLSKVFEKKEEIYGQPIDILEPDKQSEVEETEDENG